MNDIIPWVQEWGYYAVFLGSLVEGETIILSASALASQGYLSILHVAFIAFVGTTIADQLLYLVGYKYGDQLFKRFTSLQKPADKAFAYLKKYDVRFIIACRFIYGIRIASAIAIGAAKISPKRFIPLNILSAAIWSVVSCTGGYYGGVFIFTLFESKEMIQRILLIGLMVAIGGLIIYRKFFKKQIN